MPRSKRHPPSLIDLSWQRLTKVVWTEEHPRGAQAIFMTPVPDVPHLTAVQCQWIRDIRTENAHWPTEKVLVAAPDARWKQHEPLDDPQLWDQFARKDATRTLIKNLCQRHGFLRGTHPYRGLKLSWKPRDPEFFESDNGDYSGIIEHLSVPSWEHVPLIDPSDDSDVFTETEGVWRAELNALAAAKLIYHYLQPESADGDQGPALSPEPWIWQDRHYIETWSWQQEANDLRYLTDVDDGPRSEIPSVPEPWRNDSLDLQERLTLCLDHLLKQHTRGVHVQVVKKPGVPYPQMRLIPPDLITGLWLQFSLYVNSGRHVKLCAVCGQPFVGRSAKGRNCSQSCTQRKYREGQKKRKASSVTTVSQPRRDEVQQPIFS